jgi:predicted XRE-type DNA-binding protein
MKIKEWMDKEGLNNLTVAQMVGVSESYISKIVHGREPSKWVALKIMQVSLGKVVLRPDIT